MYPEIFKLGPFTLHTFGVMLASGILLASWVLMRETKRLGDPMLTEERMQKLAWYMVLAMILGGRFMHVIVETARSISGTPGAVNYLASPLRILAIWEGGLVMYGGLLTIFITITLFSRRNKINILRLLDLTAPALFFGEAVGRWGCFFAGDDYGKPTDSVIGVTFTDPASLAYPRGVPLHPTQLYMSAKALFIAFALLWITRRKRFDGQVAGAGLIMYAILRSFIELYRGDADRGSPFFGLSTAQFTSIFVFLLGVVILIKAPRRLLADEPTAPVDDEENLPNKKKKKNRNKQKPSAA